MNPLFIQLHQVVIVSKCFLGHLNVQYTQYFTVMKYSPLLILYPFFLQQIRSCHLRKE